MTKDLEETLAGLGPGYRAVVDRLTAGATVEPRSGRRALALPPPASAARRAPLLAAAALLAVLAIGTVFFRGGGHDVPPAVHAAREYRLAEIHDGLAVEEMIRTQNADGSWRNDFLTRRNAEALARCPHAGAKVAYKKAMRNLRVRGLL